MWKNILALAVGTTVALVGVEGGARMMANVLGVSSYMQYDEQVGWKAKPGSVKRHRDERMGFDVTYRINEKGLRGPVYDELKAKGRYRIVLLGDSNGFGWGIEESKYFAALLDEELPNVEVVNLSLSGYGTDQEYLRFVEEGVGYLDDIGAKGLVVHASKDVNERGYLVDSPLRVLDLYPVMSAYEQEHGVQLYYADGVHWNERGHRLIADELKKVVQQIRETASPA